MKKGMKKNILAIVERFIDDRWEFWGLFDSTIEGALINCHQESEDMRPYRFRESKDGWTYATCFMHITDGDLETDEPDFRCQNVLVQRVVYK
jgi:hypothetical protein